ncbi:MAG: hypothetical protein JWP44_4566, partial [Mucilaginibacter sp.]|nr:hypothetical protein [Mucilaginibacter sp.]
MNQNPYSPPKAPVMDPTTAERRSQPVTESRPTEVERVLAVLLMLGGIFGIGVSLYMAALLFRRQWVYSLIAGPLVLLFAWSMLTGFRLWRGRISGRTWATILFAMQIPILTFPGFSYEYYTGFSVKIIGGHVDKPVSISVGSNGNLQVLDPRVTDSAYGLNLFGL